MNSPVTLGDLVNNQAAVGLLSIRGSLKDKNGTTSYLHQGMVQRAFHRVFDLADYIVVTGASMNEGLLVVELKRELPEALKPRCIEVNGGNVTPLEPKAVEHEAA